MDFDVFVAVRGAVLQVRPGEFCVIVGPSGSGKSTLLRTANALTPATRGHVRMRDGDTLVDVARCAPETLRRLRRYRVAMVFQQFALLPTRTVGENVALGLELRGDPPDARARIVAEKLEMVGLGGWTHRPVGELSGGMQQRVGIARALATDADILLMDEPFSALDAVIRRRLQDELRALHQRLGKTILFVTHDLAEAARLGDRIAVMHDGRIAQTGTLDQVLASPATDDVAQFLHEFHR
ncbi:MAG: ATP-binding cassette domain-containing protein [Acidobacteria bacterium]|nr:ATP-binding cassette domain-containing protein [Acidobacteriota bacterium]